MPTDYQSVLLAMRLLVFSDLQATDGGEVCFQDPAKRLQDWRVNQFLRFLLRVYNGLDRVDSSKGYVMSNVQPCCTRCNYAKHTGTVDEFFGWVARVFYFNKLAKPL